ncbi:MAG: glycosyl transferase family 2 [Candidatus Cloacimonas sp. SDB]|nr:MAG: glycosyl transferase family 2 [Candidatus Cloacimonas sp. SDB]
MKLIVTIPAYNEEDSIGDVIQEIPRTIEQIDQVEILVINDGSTDNTGIVSRNAGADYIVTHKRNLGLAKTFRDGLNAALELGADIIVNTDADFQYNGTEISNLIQPILDGTADLVIGDRQINTLGHMPRGKAWGNKLATWVTRRVTGWPIHDAQTGFRAFPRDAACKMNLTGDYTYVQETLIQAVNKDMTLVQVPIEFRRRDGKSRLIGSLFGYASSAGKTIARSFRDYKPFTVFLSIGGIIIILGLILGSGILIHFLKTGMVTPYLPTAILTTVLIIVGLQVIVFGLLADMVLNIRILTEEILYRIKK